MTHCAACSFAPTGHRARERGEEHTRTTGHAVITMPLPDAGTAHTNGGNR